MSTAAVVNDHYNEEVRYFRQSSQCRGINPYTLAASRAVEKKKNAYVNEKVFESDQYHEDNRMIAKSPLYSRMVKSKNTKPWQNEETSGCATCGYENDHYTVVHGDRPVGYYKQAEERRVTKESSKMQLKQFENPLFHFDVQAKRGSMHFYCQSEICKQIKYWHFAGEESSDYNIPMPPVFNSVYSHESDHCHNDCRHFVAGNRASCNFFASANEHAIYKDRNLEKYIEPDVMDNMPVEDDFILLHLEDEVVTSSAMFSSQKYILRNSGKPLHTVVAEESSRYLGSAGPVTAN